ncbi:MAG: pitrilysin family protein [Myxococcota bacterium]|jgi:zinc protease|nr:pitrilysin family protein [Myxococcota bacterium]
MTPLVEVLPNQCTMVLLENHAAPVVALEIWVGVGSADELPPQAGLAHVHEHMIFKGTERRGVGQIAQQIEACGGEINARTSFDYTVYHVEMASSELELGLDTLADAVQHACFDAEELERELEVIREELKRTLDTPSHRASQLLFSSAFQEHGYGRPILGSLDTLNAFSRADVVDFFENWYTPSNMTFVAVGDFQVDTMRSLAHRFFDLPARPKARRQRRAEPPQTAMRLQVQSADVRETQLQLAFPIPAYAHPDVPALDALSLLLGGAASARLDSRIRRDRSLVNAIGSYSYTPLEAGLFTIAATFQEGEQSSTREVILHTLRELFQSAREPFSSADLVRAKTLIRSQSVYQQQTMRGLAQKLGFYQAVTQDLGAEARYLEAVEALSVNDLLAVAERYLRPERLNLVLFGPESSMVRSDEVAAWVHQAADEASRFRVKTRLHSDAEGIVKTELEDGSTVIVQTDRSVPLLSVWAALPGGLRDEGESDNGISSLSAELLTLGTPSRSAEELSQRSDEMGGSLSGYSGHNTFGLSSTFLSPHLGEALDLMSDCLLRSSFPEQELERERQHALDELQSQNDHLASSAFRMMSKALYGAHPYGMDLLGTQRSVQALSSDALRKRHQQVLRAKRRVIAFVGDVDPERAVAGVERYFAFPEGEHALSPLPEPERPERPLLQTRTENRQQAHLALGFLGARFDEPHRYALDLIGALLSGQGGRLFLELRDRRSLAYSLAAFNRPNYDRGAFSVYIASSPEKLDTALAQIAIELRRLGQELCTEDELERAKRYLLGSHDIGLQRGSTRASVFALNELYGLGYDFPRRYRQRISSLSAAQVREAALEILEPAHSVVAAVLPEGASIALEALQGE